MNKSAGNNIIALLFFLSLSLVSLAQQNPEKPATPPPAPAASTDSDSDYAPDELPIKGKIMITAGSGLNWAGYNFVHYYKESSYYGDTITGKSISSRDVRFIPYMNVSVNVGITDYVSVGISGGYQTYLVKWWHSREKKYMNDSWSRINVNLRGDYYFYTSKKTFLYGGVMIGYNKYVLENSTYTKYKETYISHQDIHPPVYNYQAHAGIYYFLIKNMLGVNGEIGVGYGGPYLVNAGITLKI